jgi:hypothetical protein
MPLRKNKDLLATDGHRWTQIQWSSIFLATVRETVGARFHALAFTFSLAAHE